MIDDGVHFGPQDVPIREVINEVKNNPHAELYGVSYAASYPKMEELGFDQIKNRLHMVIDGIPQHQRKSPDGNQRQRIVDEYPGVRLSDRMQHAKGFVMTDRGTPVLAALPTGSITDAGLFGQTSHNTYTDLTYVSRDRSFVSEVYKAIQNIHQGKYETPKGNTQVFVGGSGPGLHKHYADLITRAKGTIYLASPSFTGSSAQIVTALRSKLEAGHEAHVLIGEQGLEKNGASLKALIHGLSPAAQKRLHVREVGKKHISHLNAVADSQGEALAGTSRFSNAGDSYNIEMIYKIMGTDSIATLVKAIATLGEMIPLDEVKSRLKMNPQKLQGPLVTWKADTIFGTTNPYEAIRGPVKGAVPNQVRWMISFAVPRQARLWTREILAKSRGLALDSPELQKAYDRVLEERYNKGAGSTGAYIWRAMNFTENKILDPDGLLNSVPDVTKRIEMGNMKLTEGERWNQSPLAKIVQKFTGINMTNFVQHKTTGPLGSFLVHAIEQQERGEHKAFMRRIQNNVYRPEDPTPYEPGIKVKVVEGLYNAVSSVFMMGAMFHFVTYPIYQKTSEIIANVTTAMVSDTTPLSLRPGSWSEAGDFALRGTGRLFGSTLSSLTITAVEMNRLGPWARDGFFTPNLSTLGAEMIGYDHRGQLYNRNYTTAETIERIRIGTNRVVDYLAHRHEQGLPITMFERTVLTMNSLFRPVHYEQADSAGIVRGRASPATMLGTQGGYKKLLKLSAWASVMAIFTADAIYGHIANAPEVPLKWYREQQKLWDALGSRGDTWNVPLVAARGGIDPEWRDISNVTSTAFAGVAYFALTKGAASRMLGDLRFPLPGTPKASNLFAIALTTAAVMSETARILPNYYWDQLVSAPLWRDYRMGEYDFLAGSEHRITQGLTFGVIGAAAGMSRSLLNNMPVFNGTFQYLAKQAGARLGISALGGIIAGAVGFFGYELLGLGLGESRKPFPFKSKWQTTGQGFAISAELMNATMEQWALFNKTKNPKHLINANSLSSRAMMQGIFKSDSTGTGLQAMVTQLGTPLTGVFFAGLTQRSEGNGITRYTPVFGAQAPIFMQLGITIGLPYGIQERTTSKGVEKSYYYQPGTAFEGMLVGAGYTTLLSLPATVLGKGAQVAAAAHSYRTGRFTASGAALHAIGSTGTFGFRAVRHAFQFLNPIGLGATAVEGLARGVQFTVGSTVHQRPYVHAHAYESLYSATRSIRSTSSTAVLGMLGWMAWQRMRINTTDMNHYERIREIERVSNQIEQNIGWMTGLSSTAYGAYIGAAHRHPLTSRTSRAWGGVAGAIAGIGVGLLLNKDNFIQTVGELTWMMYATGAVPWSPITKGSNFRVNNAVDSANNRIGIQSAWTQMADTPELNPIKVLLANKQLNRRGDLPTSISLVEDISRAFSMITQAGYGSGPSMFFGINIFGNAYGTDELLGELSRTIYGQLTVSGPMDITYSNTTMSKGSHISPLQVQDRVAFALRQSGDLAAFTLFSRKRVGGTLHGPGSAMHGASNAVKAALYSRMELHRWAMHAWAHEIIGYTGQDMPINLFMGRANKSDTMAFNKRQSNLWKSISRLTETGLVDTEVSGMFDDYADRTAFTREMERNEIQGGDRYTSSHNREGKFKNLVLYAAMGATLIAGSITVYNNFRKHRELLANPGINHNFFLNQMFSRVLGPSSTASMVSPHFNWSPTMDVNHIIRMSDNNEFIVFDNRRALGLNQGGRAELLTSYTRNTAGMQIVNSGRDLFSKLGTLSVVHRGEIVAGNAQIETVMRTLGQLRNQTYDVNARPHIVNDFNYRLDNLSRAASDLNDRRTAGLGDYRYNQGLKAIGTEASRLMQRYMYHYEELSGTKTLGLGDTIRSLTGQQPTFAGIMRHLYNGAPRITSGPNHVAGTGVLSRLSLVNGTPTAQRAVQATANALGNRLIAGRSAGATLASLTFIGTYMGTNDFAKGIAYAGMAGATVMALGTIPYLGTAVSRGVVGASISQVAIAMMSSISASYSGNGTQTDDRIASIGLMGGALLGLGSGMSVLNSQTGVGQRAASLFSTITQPVRAPINWARQQITSRITQAAVNGPNGVRQVANAVTAVRAINTRSLLSRAGNPILFLGIGISAVFGKDMEAWMGKQEEGANYALTRHVAGFMRAGLHAMNWSFDKLGDMIAWTRELNNSTNAFSRIFSSTFSGALTGVSIGMLIGRASGAKVGAALGATVGLLLGVGKELGLTKTNFTDYQKTIDKTFEGGMLSIFQWAKKETMRLDEIEHSGGPQTQFAKLKHQFERGKVTIGMMLGSMTFPGQAARAGKKIDMLYLRGTSWSLRNRLLSQVSPIWHGNSKDLFEFHANQQEMSRRSAGAFAGSMMGWWIPNSWFGNYSKGTQLIQNQELPHRLFAQAAGLNAFSVRSTRAANIALPDKPIQSESLYYAILNRSILTETWGFGLAPINHQPQPTMDVNPDTNNVGWFEKTMNWANESSNSIVQGTGSIIQTLSGWMSELGRIITNRRQPSGFAPRGSFWDRVYNGSRSHESIVPDNWKSTNKLIASSGFGSRKAPIAGASTFHKGIDLARGVGAVHGSRVGSFLSGTVKAAFYDSGGGNMVIIDHGNGQETRYLHLSKVKVKVGDRVGSRQEIGNVGNTGNSGGPHLHFEYRVNDKAINPLEIAPLHTIVGQTILDSNRVTRRDQQKKPTTLQSRDSRVTNAAHEVQARGGMSAQRLLAVHMAENLHMVREENSAQAAGPMQFIRGTAVEYGIAKGYRVGKNQWILTQDNRQDPLLSMIAADRYMRRLHAGIEKIVGNKLSEEEKWKFVHASYNAGEDSVQQAAKKARNAGVSTVSFAAVLPFLPRPKQTGPYVQKITQYVGGKIDIVVTPSCPDHDHNHDPAKPTGFRTLGANRVTIERGVGYVDSDVYRESAEEWSTEASDPSTMRLSHADVV